MLPVIGQSVFYRYKLVRKMVLVRLTSFRMRIESGRCPVDQARNAANNPYNCADSAQPVGRDEATNQPVSSHLYSYAKKSYFRMANCFLCIYIDTIGKCDAA